MKSKYSPEFKQTAVSLITDGGLNSVQAGRKLGIDSGTIREWANKKGIRASKNIVDNIRRDPPLAYAKYLLKNPVYAADLNRRPIAASEGYLLLWVKVIEQAIESAASRTTDEDFVREATEIIRDSGLYSIERKEKLARLRTRERNKTSAQMFLESEFFKFICVECNINPEPALAAISARIKRKGQRRKRARVATYGGR
jgi:hypothetical protein